MIEALAGVLLAVITLGDVFYTVVVPGRSRGVLLLSRRLVLFALPIRARLTRRPVGVNFAPMMLVACFTTWMLLLVLAFGLMTHALADSFTPPLKGFGQALYVAGGAMTTVGFGKLDPVGVAQAVVVGAGFCGLAVLTLAVTYLLEVQANIAQRDTGVLKITTSAGEPPSAVRLLEKYAALQSSEEMARVLRDGREWCAAVLQSHASHPSLIYFRSAGTRAGWPAALGALMDLALVMEFVVDDSPALGPAVMAREEGNRLAHDLAALVDLQPDPIATSASDVRTLCDRLRDAGYQLQADIDVPAFIAMRQENVGCIDAMSRHLGARPTPLLAD